MWQSDDVVEMLMRQKEMDDLIIFEIWIRRLQRQYVRAQCTNAGPRVKDDTSPVGWLNLYT